MPAHQQQAAKRAFVKTLLTLAREYAVDVSVTRDSSEADVEAAFRKVVRKVHPDRGGSTQDMQQLQNSREAWSKLRASTPPASEAGPAPKSRHLRLAASLLWRGFLPKALARVGHKEFRS